MARISFKLRTPSVSIDNTGGSYVRYDTDAYNLAASTGNAASPGVWLEDTGTRDYDSALRADGIVLSPEEVPEGYLEVSAVGYGVVNAKFGVPITLLEGEPVVGSSPSPYEAILVYSPTRPPISVGDGQVVSPPRSYTDSDIDISDLPDGGSLPEGRWAYFTLFVRYLSTLQDDYYIAYASTEVLVPRNYGSTLRLWERIPESFRTQDELIGTVPDDYGFVTTPAGQVSVATIGAAPVGLSFGPLFRFLSIFGFEVDRVRTTLDYLMISKDPREANSSSINALCEMLGTGVSSNDINIGRLRNFLEVYGRLLRKKGTLSGVTDLVRVLALSESELDDLNKLITIFSQRVNYCWDPSNGEDALSNTPEYREAHEVEAIFPEISQGVFAGTDSFDPDNPATFPQSSVSYAPGMYWAASAGTFDGITVSDGDLIVMYGDPAAPSFGVRPSSFTDTHYSSYTNISVSGVAYATDNSNNDIGVNHMWVRFPSPVPVRLGDYVYASVHSGSGDLIVRGRLSDVSTGDIVGEGGSIEVRGEHVAQVQVSANASPTAWTLCFMEILVDMSGTGASFALSSTDGGILIERNFIGHYFDGDTKTGTWVLGSDGFTTDRDYRWSTRGSYNSSSTFSGPGISVYTEEFNKTVTLLQKLFPKFFPAQEYAQYDFAPSVTVYDGVPGLDDIDAYYDSLAP